MPTVKETQNGTQLTGHDLAGRTIRMIRRTHGATLRETAALVGISETTLRRIESGQRPTSHEQLNRICRALAELSESKERP